MAQLGKDPLVNSCLGQGEAQAWTYCSGALQWLSQDPVAISSTGSGHGAQHLCFGQAMRCQWLQEGFRHTYPTGTGHQQYLPSSVAP